VLLVTACGTGSQEDPGATGDVTVFAAASLTKAFGQLAERFEAEHEGAHVRLSFAGSQSLVAQLQQGAPADVLATADEATMARVVSPTSDSWHVFAHNQLAVVTAAGNPQRITSLADLSRPGLKVVLAAPSVPVGRAAAGALAAAGVTVRPVSLEDAVTGVLGKVRLGEADAGIAYATDLGSGVGGFAVPGTRTNLCVAALTGAGQAFADFVRSPDAQVVLRRHGFR
jgi:molybdate transport system substrate-binding protein